MYESPIKVVFSDIVSDSVKKTDEYIVRCVQQVGVNVDRDALIKALKFDRGQYEKGWNDRDNEIVRCKDCVNCSECITDDGMYIYIRCLRNGATIYEDDFCSWGERREDGKID